jgi:hypothetical protein
MDAMPDRYQDLCREVDMATTALGDANRSLERRLDKSPEQPSVDPDATLHQIAERIRHKNKITPV